MSSSYWGVILRNPFITHRFVAVHWCLEIWSVGLLLRIYFNTQGHVATLHIIMHTLLIWLTLTRCNKTEVIHIEVKVKVIDRWHTGGITGSTMDIVSPLVWLLLLDSCLMVFGAAAKGGTSSRRKSGYVAKFRIHVFKMLYFVWEKRLINVISCHLMAHLYQAHWCLAVMTIIKLFLNPA